MQLEAMTGLGGAGAPPHLMAALEARGIGTVPGGGLGALGTGRPDPHQALADRGVSIEGLSNVADVLGTSTEELATELGDDGSFADLVERARSADVDPREFMQAVASDLGGPAGGPPFGGGSPFGGASPFGGVSPFGGGSAFGGGAPLGSSLPPLVFDSAAADPTSDLLVDWLSGGEADEE